MVYVLNLLSQKGVSSKTNVILKKKNRVICLTLLDELALKKHINYTTYFLENNSSELFFFFANFHYAEI